MNSKYKFIQDKTIVKKKPKYESPGVCHDVDFKKGVVVPLQTPIVTTREQVYQAFMNGAEVVDYRGPEVEDPVGRVLVTNMQDFDVFLQRVRNLPFMRQDALL